ncbi:MAG: Maf family protein [Proteobacteria bacterium]|nr:Maf family protein [Pseudomonadota bacterium]
MPLLLASESPQRLALLKQIGITPHATYAPGILETPRPGELPTNYVVRMAYAKAEAVADKLTPQKTNPSDWILAADTEVVMGRRILGKPKNADAADQFLQMLSGRRHQVLTAVVLMRGDKTHARHKLSKSHVKMAVWDKPARVRYIKSQEWQGKAGGYGLQGMAAAWVMWIRGSYSGIIGLPLAETAHLLKMCEI